VTDIPLVDLAWQRAQIEDEVQSGFAAVLKRCDFIGGGAVKQFEEEYAAFLGVRHVVGVANGTDAIEMALRALGVGLGDEVIIPANTFIATAEAVVRAGAKPVLVDCDDEAMLLDPTLVEAAITAETKAIAPVHLYGQFAPIEQLPASLVQRGIAVVEDAAQSQGATRNGRAGGLGRIAATSFYPGTNLGAFGDAGAVMTDDDELATAVRLLGAHGSAVKYEHTRYGFNSRLDTLQAVVLRAKLARLADWNALRRQAAQRYADLLGDLAAVRLPATLAGNEHVWHLYVIRVEDRDAVLKQLHAEGVGAGIHYPVPVHLQPAFADLGYAEGDFPVTEAAGQRILSLPIFPGITEAQQQRVSDVLHRILG
jgi:dTDP-4-amino-4,6-dideoxygalactose transaminase